jgi:GAF domain-containing protein
MAALLLLSADTPACRSGLAVVAHERYAALLAKISQTLITDYGIADVLHDLCDDVVDLLPVRGAGVMLADDRDRMHFVAASDRRVALIEVLQEQFGEGPCLDAYRHGTEVLVADLGTDDRYPRFSPAALEQEMKSAHAFPMRVHERLIGALSVYADEVVDLDEAETDALRTLAASATAFILNHRALDEAVELAGQLQVALNSRIVIEQAKGRLAEQLEIDVSEAFLRIRKHARDQGLKLRDVAQQLVDGDLTLA